MMKSIAASTVTLFYALAIFYLSFVSAGTLGAIYKRVGIRGGVSLLHVLAFALLAVLIRYMFSTRLYKTWIPNPRAWSVYTAGILAGILEFLQVFMPTRHARARDLLLHAAGIFIFFIVDRGMDKYGKWRECC
jgi:VanZ family protein